MTEVGRKRNPPPTRLVTNARLLEPGKRVSSGDLLVENGRVAAVGHEATDLPDGVETVDAGGCLLTPGLVDLHTHGIERCIYELGPEQMSGACDCLARYGVTTVLPTTVPQTSDEYMERLAAVAATLPSIRNVSVPGLHLEGPFLALPGSGAATIPGDLVLLEELFEACRNRVTAMSVSPDAKNILPVIERLRERDVAVFLTHTRASVEETEAAIEAGARHATHFYDVFYPPAEKDPGVRPVGVVEAVLADPRATVDFIADGIHVHPTAIRAAVAAKGFEGISLITDSNVGAGLPPDVYNTPNGFRVRIEEGGAPRHETMGVLAGSALTMNRGMENLLDWLDLPPEQVWAMGTVNPARVVGLQDRGTLEVGSRADLVVWDNDLSPIRTWIGGCPAWQGG
jgi:N-acetylglucosamine-6-phosphate deacetylase